MTQALWIEIMRFAVQFGIDAAIELAKAIKSGGNIDNAIAALESAKTKTAQQYLDEAKANSTAANP